MTFIQHKYCPKCERETGHVNSRCSDCVEREYRAHVAAWNAQTTDKKLQDLRKRVEHLERGPARYA